MLRGDISKNDSRADAVFTEQGSSASQMSAAKVMDVIARSLGCDGQPADAVSVHTQVNLEDAPPLLRIPKSDCPDVWIRFPRHKWPKSCANVEDPVIPVERNCTDTHSLDYCGKNNAREFCWNLDGKKYHIGNICLFIESNLV